MVTQIDNLDVHVLSRLRLLQHPLGGLVGKAGGARGTNNQGNTGLNLHGFLMYGSHYEKPW